MRLEKVRRGEGIKRFLYPVFAWKLGAPVPDVVRTLLHRPKLFGNPYNQWIQAVLRGPSPWSVSERELFASFTSRLNQCVF